MDNAQLKTIEALHTMWEEQTLPITSISIEGNSIFFQLGAAQVELFLMQPSWVVTVQEGDQRSRSTYPVGTPIETFLEGVGAPKTPSTGVLKLDVNTPVHILKHLAALAMGWELNSHLEYTFRGEFMDTIETWNPDWDTAQTLFLAAQLGLKVQGFTTEELQLRLTLEAAKIGAAKLESQNAG